MRNSFQHPLEGHSKTSNEEALLNPFDHYIKMKACMRVEWGGALYPGVDCPLPPLTLFIGTIHEKLFSVSWWRASRNFKWPGSSQSLWSLHKNESMHEGCEGGGTLYPGVDCHPTPTIDYARYKKKVIDQRLCKISNENGCVEDEFHFLMTCKAYQTERNEFFTKLNAFIVPFESYICQEQFLFLMSTNDTEVIMLLMHFIEICLQVRQSSGR